MNQSITNELERIVKIIVQTVPVERIYLFGSYAYGVPNEESDIDIYVVLNDDTPFDASEARDKIGLALYKQKTLPADILALKKSRFEYRQGTVTLENEVANKGVVLYG
ncbi:hypothetical protein FACS189454_01220 [Planctomycetales bacterium]|nr:hypothetical protein FACS189454_01220 [Planctomycetales bacterium]